MNEFQWRVLYLAIRVKVNKKVYGPFKIDGITKFQWTVLCLARTNIERGPLKIDLTDELCVSGRRRHGHHVPGVRV